MNTIPFVSALILATSAAFVPAFAPARCAPATATRSDDADEDGDKLVGLSLAFDHASAKPGDTITVALRAAVRPRWHVYWGPNAGDSGLPFQADLKGPAGWTVGPARFPWPKRDVAEGDIVQYLHEGELVVLFDVAVPADAKPGAFDFTLDARWLACTDVCLPGSGKTAGRVTVGAESKLADEAFFAAARQRTPRPWSELGRVLVTPAGDGAQRTITLVVPGAKAIEFYPYRTETSAFTGRTIEVGKQGATARLAYELEEKQEGVPRTAGGVLWVKTEAGETSYEWKHTFQP